MTTKLNRTKGEEELINSLLEKDEEFKEAYNVHEDYDKRLAEIDKRVYLSTEDQIERKRLQKLKLSEKDRMEVILQKYRAAV